MGTIEIFERRISKESCTPQISEKVDIEGEKEVETFGYLFSISFCCWAHISVNIILYAYFRN